MNEVQQAIGSWLKGLIKEAVTEALQEKMNDLIKVAVKEILHENLLSSIREADVQSSNPLERFYSRDEVCEKLSICHATFHNWVNSGKLRSVKIQGRCYIDALCLEKALEEGTIKSKSNN